MPTVSPVQEVPGLTHVQNLLSEQHQLCLTAMIELEGWFESSNQVMQFGSMAGWCSDLAACIPLENFPAEISGRRPVFDQVTGNRYAPGEGLKAHVDLLRFKDGICIFALGSSAIVEFSRPDSTSVVEVRMASGDLLMMHGAARYEWLHGIPARLCDPWHGGQLKQRTVRTSLTFRALHREQ